MHVTLRSAFRPLRSQHVFPTVCFAIRGATLRNPERFRVVHFSVQWDHVHLIVEARDARALSAGIRSVAIRIARYVNELVMRRGRLWSDRWHGRALTSPRAVRNALVYVFANFRKHAKKRLAPGVDAFSSAVAFDGWQGVATGSALPRAGPPIHTAMAHHVVVSESKTWLGATGWRRAGLVGVNEAPERAQANESLARRALLDRRAQRASLAPRSRGRGSRSPGATQPSFERIRAGVRTPARASRFLL